MSLGNQIPFMGGSEVEITPFNAPTENDEGLNPLQEKIHTVVGLVVANNATATNWEDMARITLQAGIELIVRSIVDKHDGNISEINPLEERDNYFRPHPTNDWEPTKIVASIRNSLKTYETTGKTVGITISNCMARSLEALMDPRELSRYTTPGNKKTAFRNGSQTITGFLRGEKAIRGMGRSGSKF